ncbi:succinylglutamate desuccinylase/aspartoacylase family protein [Venatoribacter cucullus]|uniref:succinylglutamate desuccinylase/aspartoacylase family protein n=1 Tax=Venatoribacter cucullus TaxID=2661630 RepID=UPI00193631E2|nr:succinylglutamate desuccinylase/aspartoacylase family protein [Venatoribacter cucullus]QQD22143.1 succinylglutamate desuccinylase [Oceanospirillaceae bacterium ASx5O]UZK04202.1 succinylglutamate desuccinylase [Venatoribacter cucullus]
MQSSVLEIAGVSIQPGETRKIELPVGRLYTDASVAMPIYVKRGRRAGPTLFISAAVHGDELNGIAIIQRLIASKALNSLRGTLIAVPVVNVYGVISHSRYLPDRRDLNRSFPGSKKGSLAARMANMFLEEIVSKCDYGIDFHTGAIHRSNLPQIRANLDDEETAAMARAFGVPVLLNSDVRDGSLRGCAAERGVKTLLYEAGEALRFDELCIRAGERGTINVLRHLGMLPKSRSRKTALIEPVVARTSAWERATDSGFVQYHKELGDRVKKQELLATIRDPFGTVLADVRSRYEGIIIGKQNIPLAQEGEAMFHIAYFHQPDDVVGGIEQLQDLLPDEALN